MTLSDKHTAAEDLLDLKNDAEFINEENDYTKELQCIGLRIAYFRRVRNMTQAELASRVGINKNYLSHIECGRTNKAISLPLLIHISKILNVKLSVMVDLDDWANADDKSSEAIAIQEMRQMFNEMCQLNEELDRAMERMDEIDSGETTMDIV